MIALLHDFFSYYFALHDFFLVTAHPPPGRSDVPPLSVVHVQVCFKSFLFILKYISFLPARVAANSITRICASGWFVQMENSNCRYTQY